ncbi:hypothetical protein RND71_016476 [Anisodus tanguticus]|uniref:Uncharacterized protein n=1 Tax=Anisodus tanguticus TaxID=243964 RepID=A0AAE1S9C6_9SOLA|nr:hypothetical protein RND71_016476 [Anisodus tanguticus]
MSLVYDNDGTSTHNALENNGKTFVTTANVPPSQDTTFAQPESIPTHEPHTQIQPAHELISAPSSSHYELSHTSIPPLLTPPSPPSPPPAPTLEKPPPLPQYMEPRSSKSNKNRGGANATKEFINSLYHKKKRKNRSKGVDNFDALLHKSEPHPLHYQWPASSTPPPSPPPLPPLSPPPPTLFKTYSHPPPPLFLSRKSHS